MASIKKDISKLREKDTYSLLLFGLYQLVGIPEYSSLSELSYVLDKDNLLNLCEFFGGQTVKIPTIDELEDMLNVLLVYQYVKIEGKTYTEAIKLLNKEPRSRRQLWSDYQKMSEILEKYDFNTGRD